MVTKAIIKKLNTLEDNHLVVYVPFLRKANADELDATLEATLIAVPGIENSLRVGDVVYVSFEDNNYDRPVILGKLYIEIPSPEDITTTTTNRTLEVTQKATLPQNTVIGDLNIVDIYTKLNYLLGSDFFEADQVIYGQDTPPARKEDITNVKQALDYLLDKVN